VFVLSNETPYAVERTVIADKDGSDVWVVALKGTFTIGADGKTAVADTQQAVLPFPEHFGDPLTTSLRYECDLDYTKPTTDVLVHGHAYAPKGRPTTEVDVAIRVGPVSKSLHVVGDRTWREGALGLKLSEPEPFEKMPIRYERAFGGADLQSDDPKRRGWEPGNPIGTGYSLDGKPRVCQLAPNIEAGGASAGLWKPRLWPAGLGPIARHWAPRAKLAGTYDDRWEEERLPLLPKDFDERFFQCAPEDQQPPQYLRGHEEVELHNLTPDGVLRFLLPRVALRFETQMAGEMIRHRARLHTVVIEPDVPRVIMVWHTSLPCRGKKLKITGTTIVEKPYLN
jgi:hypothetical protein